MANVFGILTAIVLALSAFIAFKNKTAYENKIGETNAAKDTLVKSEARQKDREAEAARLPGEIAEVTAKVEALKVDEAAQTKTNEGLEAQSKEKTDKIASNKQKLDEIREKTKDSGDLQELASKMRTTSAELEDLSQSIAASEAKLANLTSQNTSSETQVNAVKTKFENFSSGQSLPALRTRIRSIYPNWGFVTLASGNNAGVVANSTLNVVRDGETVAKLLVTAVESNTSSASIIPDSIGQDVTLQVGDSVVPGSKAATTTPAAGN